MLRVVDTTAYGVRYVVLHELLQLSREYGKSYGGKTVGGQVSSRRRHWSYHYDRHCYQRPGMQTIAYKMQKRHKLDEKTKAKRLARARLITGFYISWEQKQLRFGLLPPSVVWPDEKVFAVEAKFNQQNDRIYCVCKTSPTT